MRRRYQLYQCPPLAPLEIPRGTDFFGTSLPVWGFLGLALEHLVPQDSPQLNYPGKDVTA